MLSLSCCLGVSIITATVIIVHVLVFVHLNCSSPSSPLSSSSSRVCLHRFPHTTVLFHIVSLAIIYLIIIIIGSSSIISTTLASASVNIILSVVVFASNLDIADHGHGVVDRSTIGTAMFLHHTPRFSHFPSLTSSHSRPLSTLYGRNTLDNSGLILYKHYSLLPAAIIQTA